MTSPVKAYVRPQRFPSGLGASNVIASRNRPSRNTPKATASTSAQPIASTTKHASETSSSLPANPSTTICRRSSGQYSNQEHHLNNSLPDKIPQPSSLPHRLDLGSTNGSRSIHAGKVRYVDTSKSTTKHRPDSHHPTSPKDVGNTYFLDNRAPHLSPNDFPFFFFPASPLVQSVPLHLPPLLIDSRDNEPVNLPLGLPPRPVHSNPPTFTSQTGIPYVTKSKGKNVVLGMPMDDAKVGGTRGTFPKILEPLPNPSCSLVMELLPRRFRTEPFILDWLSQFSFKPRRYELVEGKAFFEFETERDAHNAWYSPRMGGLEGLFGVRLYWYRVLPQTTLKDVDTIRKVNATRTIENPAQSRPQPVSDSTNDLGNHLGLRSGFKADRSHSHIPTQKAASPPPPPSPLTTIEEDSGVPVNPNTPAENSTSNSYSQKPHNTSSERFSGDSAVTSPAVTTRPLAAPTAPSDCPNNRMRYSTMGDLPPGGVPGFIPPGVIASSTASTSLSPTSSSSRTLPSTLPTSPPEVLNSAVDTMFVDHQPPPALNRHVQTSNLAAPVGTEVKGVQFEKIDGTPLGADDFMDTTDSMALAKEQALRKMVLQSRKRKLLEPSGTKQPTSAPTSTATSRNALEDLAVNFIADAIAHPRPAKIVKITPSAAAMAAWGKRLEQHVESSKAIMAKIQLARSRAERNRLLEILREKDWCVSR